MAGVHGIDTTGRAGALTTKGTEVDHEHSWQDAPFGKACSGCSATVATKKEHPRQSHVAARSTKVKAVRSLVEETLRRGSMTDERLVATIRGEGHAASPSGIRSRRAELTRDGVVEQDGYGITVSGREARRWRLKNRSGEPITLPL